MIERDKKYIAKLKEQKQFEIRKIKSKTPLIAKGTINNGSIYHVCPSCFRLLNFKNFRKYKIGWLDYEKNRRFGRCRKCESDYQKNKREERPAYRLWKLARRRAKEKKIPFDITVENIEDIWPKDNICPITMKKFKSGIKNKMDLPTLDKIIRKKGYIKGNIAVISFQANSVKGTIDDFNIFKRLSFFYDKYATY